MRFTGRLPYNEYAEESYSGVVIPANIAVESSISQAVHLALHKSRVAGSKRINNFLTSKDASYSSFLQVFLPLLADRFSFPRLPDDLRGLLDRLRKLRNEMAHTGVLKTTISKPEIAELLAASTVGFLYGRQFRTVLREVCS
ncbi:hypothetical protein K8T06_13320 [bacterium]|nr:hypothetical protein [bacterium]